MLIVDYDGDLQIFLVMHHFKQLSVNAYLHDLANSKYL